jgi:hypothetical protein
MAEGYAKVRSITPALREMHLDAVARRHMERAILRFKSSRSQWTAALRRASTTDLSRTKVAPGIDPQDDEIIWYSCGLPVLS